MRCNKKQFEAIKPKLDGMEIGCIYSFNKWNYLVNNEDGYYFVVCNTAKSGIERYNREIHKTWNERIFLEACGIEKKEHFEITKETIIKYKMKDEFPEVFYVKLEVGKWYRKPNTPFIYHILEIKDKNNIKAYGFDSKGEYSNTNKFDWGTPEDSTKATEQEVFEVLKNEAVKRYNDGGYVKRFNSSLLLKVDSEFKSELKDGDLWYGGGVVFREGKWATIIPTKTKEEAEKLLNCKIID